MNKKLILPIMLIVLVGMSTFVYAQRAGEAQVNINEGWNLVYGLARLDQLDEQVSIGKNNIKAIYAFISTTQEYARAYPDPETGKLALIDDDELIQTAFWVYSTKSSADTEYWLDDLPVPLDERPMYSGWNFVGVTPEMVPGPADTNLKDIKGDCNIEKSYFFNADLQKWDEVPVEFAQLEENSVGTGWVIKVSDNCRLGEPSMAAGQPPALP